MLTLNKIARIIIWGTIMAIIILFGILPHTTLLERHQLHNLDQMTKELDSQIKPLLTDLNQILSELEDLK